MILFAGAKNSSVLYIIFEPNLDCARSINPFKKIFFFYPLEIYISE